MINKTFIDKILENLLKKDIAHRYNKEMTTKETAKDLNISEDYVADLFKEWDLDKIDDEYYPPEETYAEDIAGDREWAELHGASQEKDGSWII